MICKQTCASVALACAFMVFSTADATAQTPAVDSRTALHNTTPSVVKGATLLSHANASDTMDVTVWLNLRNRSELDSLAATLYNPESPSYRHWLTHGDVVRKFLPTAAQLNTVRAYLTSHNLSVTSVGPDNISLRAHGAVADMEKAFHVEINQYQQNGHTFRSNASDASVDASVAGLVRSISGLDDLHFQHHLATRSGTFEPHTAQARSMMAPSAVNSGNADSSGLNFFTSACFSRIATETLGTPGEYPWARYKGNTLFSSPVEPGCGYTPAEVRTAYNLNNVYKKGFDGTGQTIVIIDWCGSPTITADANTFSQRFGLPPLTPDNFQIINYPAPSTCASEDSEINLDVEWAHAIAPGAKLVLLVPPTADFQDTDIAQYYAETSGLGNIISESYGAEERYMAASEVETENLISEIGSVLGVAVTVSTGDNGHYFTAFPVFSLPSVSMPAASPYVTAVGGVSTVLYPNGSINWQIGWGTNEAILAENGEVNPVVSLINHSQEFVFGSGGGTSALLPAPSFQSHLGATNRQLPDISWLADPFTPVVITITIPGVYPQVYETIGGTSLACPMFAGLWAIANQEAGENLGQAAPYLYSMPAGTITDVVPVGSQYNVNGVVYRSPSSATVYSSTQLAAPLYSEDYFVSALYNPPSSPGTTLNVSFGTDDGLLVTKGWDFATGLGTPNGDNFVSYFNPASSKK